MRRAAYPLVLDPEIGTDILIGGTTFDDTGPDVAYDDTNNTYLVVWQRGFSALNYQVRAQRVDTGGLQPFTEVRKESPASVPFETVTQNHDGIAVLAATARNNQGCQEETTDQNMCF